MGNSGPLDPQIADVIETNELDVAAVLSGNRNFEGRIHALCRMNYLASPPLVVAYALTGTLDIDLSRDPANTSHANGDALRKFAFGFEAVYVATAKQNTAFAKFRK